MIPNIKTRLMQEVSKERDKYVTKNEPETKKGDELVQATAATVGFVSEIIYHRKEKASRETRHTQVAPPDDSIAASKSPRVSETAVPEPVITIKDLAAAFLGRHPIPNTTPSQVSIKLATPILIPQRRPNTRARGFTPAFAPILSSYDISQTTFLDFIITLNTSLEPNPYLNAINLAGFAGEASPEPIISLMVGIGVEVVTDAIMEAQSRAKSNGFLDKVNEGFFAPRGLFAFVGTWRPNDDENEHVVDVNTHDGTSASRSELGSNEKVNNIATGNVEAKIAWGNLKEQMQRAMVSAGGEVATVSTASLVWASADDIAAATPSGMSKKKDRFDRAGVWLDNHVDKHTQVKWTQEYPDHPLARSLPKPEFRSRYADPTHAASSGDVVALLTGGQWHIKEDEKKREKKLREKEERARKKENKLEEKEKKLEEKERKLAEKQKKKLDAKENKQKFKQIKPEADILCSKKDVSQSSNRAENSGTKKNTNEAGEGKPAEKIVCKPSKHDSDKLAQSSSERPEQDTRSSNGVSSLLKNDLLYLVIVQHPSLSAST
ncbi:hypothetical protein C7974DRAFT_84842 [Boeremia exigua]|uniref:uncharacterized protein n=1 Tax=Boeremia exigua TaxID=749465 RepID=UPI001E8E34CF|nr:uncharacterized protein C7974DRAFT_84842 [Boeremia exigua]KAH6612756.1 hypothetical protein C7974DRAFT_84842 [Boeremia exigua]